MQNNPSFSARLSRNCKGDTEVPPKRFSFVMGSLSSSASEAACDGINWARMKRRSFGINPRCGGFDGSFGAEAMTSGERKLGLFQERHGKRGRAGKKNPYVKV